MRPVKFYPKKGYYNQVLKRVESFEAVLGTEKDYIVVDMDKIPEEARR